MISLDTVTAFELLHESGLRVARSRYVDSAEDAISFAERRNAADPRFSPIVLRVAWAASVDWEGPRRLESEAAVRKEYGVVAKAGSRVLAQSLPSGTDVTIVGQRVRGLCEITMKPPNVHHAVREGTRHMFVHIVERLHKMFLDHDLASFEILVRLHENEYTIVDAAIAASRMPLLKPRLGQHARDRKEYDFRPSGEQ